MEEEDAEKTGVETFILKALQSSLEIIDCWFAILKDYRPLINVFILESPAKFPGDHLLLVGCLKKITVQERPPLKNICIRKPCKARRDTSLKKTFIFEIPAKFPGDH